MMMNLLNMMMMVLPTMMSMSYMTLAERKVIAAMQLSKGPNLVGPLGILQPFADALKLCIKENMSPSLSNNIIFTLAPMLSLSLALIMWAVIPFGSSMYMSNMYLGVLFMLSISSLNVYGILFSGWSSNSKYAFLGSLSSTAQMISYEVSMSIIVMTVVICAYTYNLIDMVNSSSIPYIIPLFPVFMMFFMSTLAETSSSPFDLPEGESELVAGYNAEYSSLKFALFFMAEYLHMLVSSFMLTMLFLNPSTFMLPMYVNIFIFMFMWMRASFPRYRYDGLMMLMWKSFLPLSLAFLFFINSMLYSYNV